jgi:hypothetical protein
MSNAMRFRSASVLLAVALAGPAQGAVERVWVTRASQDDITVQRANGDLWRLGIPRECAGLYGSSGQVLIHYAVAFPGPEPRILVPEYDADCRVTRADSVGHRAPPAPKAAPERGLRALRETLELLGYDCGPLTTRGWTPDAARAFTRYRESRRLDASPQGVKRAVTALAIDALGGRAASGTGQRRSQAIADESAEIVDYLVKGGAAECDEPTYVRGVAADSSYFTLLDGTVWDVEALRRGAVAGWLAGDGVLACGGRLVNLRTGEMARAVRLR